MASKSEMTTGIEMVVQESKRISTALTDPQWASVVDIDGWKNKEVLAHVAAVGGIVVQFVQGMAAAAPGANAMGGVDIDTLNAALVAQRANASMADLVNEIEKNYAGVIEFIRGAEDDVLAKPVTAGGYKDVPVSELIMRMVVLHGLAHIYSVYSSVFNAKD